MEKSEKFRTITLTMDDERYQKLKETAKITKLPMSEITRLALDRLWADIGDLNDMKPEAYKILYRHTG